MGGPFLMFLASFTGQGGWGGNVSKNEGRSFDEEMFDEENE